GLSIILAYPFLRYIDNIISIYTIGILLFFMGALIQTMTFDFNWLLWVGFRPEGFHSVDYFPMLPWFGLVLLGLALGKTYYPKYERNFDEPREPHRVEEYLCFLGRHTLKVYMIHQPVLFAILYLLGYNLF
ncbi:MAG: heparan-alpha-glucosaminide N-acetyltransferase domain-containing protein, partial [Candidatus Aenigmatarchaeota archaeon]